ncbi:MAG: RidA family protein [Rhodoferax sp.]|uniref:RidA family protein n=1 Tax=Rhodoferax sp. TaxID=50421 RepID=UPI0026045005|nr:RidA family protein [Rhodoferax sp.]MDD2880554.1 RidA family protein [Rhodoferax sp.]
MADIQRLHIGPRLSEACIHAGTIYLAGQVPTNTANDIEGQTSEVLAMVDQLLAECGSSKQHILMTHIFLTDMKDYPGMNTAWDGWVAKGHAPPRATVQASLANPDWRIEIVVTAAVI